MIAIQTRYVGPTNSRGSRIIARWMARPGGSVPRSVTVPYSYSDGPDVLHRQAAEALLRRSAEAWGAEPLVVLASGGTDDGYVHVVSYPRNAA